MSTQKIQTSFGLVTIFKKKSDENTKITDAKEIVDAQETHQPTELSQIDSKALSANEDENFFGLESTKETKETDLDNLNYIDEQLLGGYKKEDDAASSLPNNASKSEIIEETDLNFVDQYYFSKNNNNDNNNNEGKQSKSEDITKAQLEDTSDLNYIDRMTFQADKSGDESIGSIISLKKTEKKIKFKENIPLIVTKSNADDEESNANKFKDILRHNESKNKDTDKKNNSNHKLIDSEVPKWYNLTIDDAAKILKNHICYMNQEGKVISKFFFKYQILFIYFLLYTF